MHICAIPCAIGPVEGYVVNVVPVHKMPRSAKAIPLIFFPLILAVATFVQFGIPEQANRKLFVGGLLIGFGSSLFVSVCGAVGWLCTMKKETCNWRETFAVLVCGLLLLAVPSSAVIFTVGEEMRSAIERGAATNVMLGFAIGGLCGFIFSGYSLFVFLQLRRRRTMT